MTRLIKIGDIPSSVYWDEASIGYNAYSISQDGKDEWGKFLPIHFRAFGEFKLPVYIYSVVPFVKLLGLNEFSVRFPAVLFSLGTMILTYLLAKKISDSEKIALFSAFFLSISPWFFIFSRTGYEACAGLMFYLLGLYLFLNNKKNSWYIFFSIISFIFSVYSYNSFRIIIPLTITILFIMEFSSIRKIMKYPGPMILSVIFLILSIIPIYRLYMLDTGTSRLQAVSTNSSSFLKNYLSHFNPDFLFINGDMNLRSQQFGFGQLYIIDLILLPLGILFIISRKSKLGYLIIFLTFISPIPASITKESPHALRTISIVPLLSMFSAFGIANIKRYLTNNYVEFLLIIIALSLFAYYFTNFMAVYPKQSSLDWQYGYKKIYTDFGDKFSKYDQIIISDEYAQPYIFTLFYLKYNPNNFRTTVLRNDFSNWGFSSVLNFDKFKFGKINDLINKNLKNSLIFASKKEKLPDVNPISTINFLNGEIAFWVYNL